MKEESAMGSPFRVEETTIEELHAAIRSGATTVRAVVEQYLARARVRRYNGVASQLVTADGTPVFEATGAMRAGAPLRFPTATVKAADVLPNLDRYKGLRFFDFSR
jgi:amidase